MSEENKKFRIGEFARVNGVTKHTLIHYDDIGLLTPAITGENGYRYYIDKQYSDFSNISQLKELGLSLRIHPPGSFSPAGGDPAKPHGGN